MKLTCFKVLRCDEFLSGSFPLPLRGCVHFPEGIKKLSLSEGSFEASGGLGREDRERCLGEPTCGRFGEEHRKWGFLREQRVEGVGEQEPGLCFGERKGGRSVDDFRLVKCFDELGSEKWLFEDLKGVGQAFPRDCAKGLLLTASPVVCMTLMCC